MGGLSFSDDPETVRLKDFLFRFNECFRYEYASQTAGSTNSVSKLSWHRNPIGVIRYVSMAGVPVHWKIVAVRGRSWRCGSGIRWAIS